MKFYRYKGRSLAEIHQKYKLNDMHYNIFVSHLMNALNSIGIYVNTMREISKHLEDWKKEIVYKVPFFDKIGGRSTIN